VATVASAGQGRARIAIILATLSSTAFLSAQGTTQLVASAFLDVPIDLGAAPTATTTVTPHVRDGHPLLSHQIFDSALGEMPWDPPVVEGEGGAEGGCESDADCAPGETCTEGACSGGPPPTTWSAGDPRPPPCDGSIRLVGSYVRRTTPDQSFAAITGSTGSSLLYRSGMVVDERTILAIQPDFVVMRPQSTGQLCSIGMFGEAPPIATARTLPVAPVVPPEAGGGDPALGISAEEMEQNIQQISETNFSINRTLVDRLLANQAALMSAARVIPHEEDGHVVGVKIYGIRRSSLLGHLGIQNGDMLRTLNGYDLTDPTAVLDAYGRLRTADSLSISMVRRGQPVTVDYSIH
jgi:general secretion pathway protein C